MYLTISDQELYTLIMQCVLNSTTTDSLRIRNDNNVVYIIINAHPLTFNFKGIKWMRNKKLINNVGLTCILALIN